MKKTPPSGISTARCSAGVPAGSLQLAGELTERSLGYPLNVMSLLYYECGDTLTTGDESAPHH